MTTAEYFGLRPGLTVSRALASLHRLGLAFVVLVHRIVSAVALTLIFEVAVTPRAVRLNAQDT